MSKAVQKPDSNNNIFNEMIKVLDTNDEDNTLKQEEPYDHVLLCSGKKIRSKLINAFNHWLQIPDNINNEIQYVIEMLHNASLLIDDIEDNSVQRRGLPVAHHVYGIPSTINAANYAYFKALNHLIEKMPNDKIGQAVTIFTKQMLLLHQGQGMDIYWRDSYICPTLNEYLDMIDKKTTGLFGLALKLMQLFTKNQQNYMFLIKLIGQYFQIRDDYANLKYDEYAEQKTFAEDLTEGKFSFPVIHAITTYPKDRTILNILRLRTNNETVKRFAIKHLEKLKSMSFTLETLETLKKKIFEEIEKMPQNPYLVCLLNSI